MKNFVLFLMHPLISQPLLLLSKFSSLVPHCFFQPRERQHDADEAKAKFSHAKGDHLTLLNLYQAYKKHSENSSLSFSIYSHWLVFLNGPIPSDGSPAWCEENYVNEAALKSADNARIQLKSIMRRFNIKLCSTDPSNCNYHDNIRKALLAGYFMQAAKLDTSGHYVTVKHQHVSSFITSSGGHCYVSFIFAFDWH